MTMMNNLRTACHACTTGIAIVIATFSTPAGLVRYGVGEEVGDTPQSERPASVKELLRQGLAKTDITSIRRWKECHDDLVIKGGDVNRADLALALILARAGRYEDMRLLLATSAERKPASQHVLRLLSWARLSDRQFNDGLADVSTLVALSIDPATKNDPSDTEDAIRYAGQAFGFAQVAIKEVQPSSQKRYEELRDTIDGLLPEPSKEIFAYATDQMQIKVQQALQEVRGRQADQSGQQQAEKEARKEELEARQRELEAEAAHRRQQAATIEKEARAQLQAIQQQAAPHYSQLEGFEAELSSLLNAQSREKETFDKKRFDPAIAIVRGQIAGVQATLRPLVSQYNQVEQAAMGQLAALGMRVQQLGRIHGADNLRLNSNEAKKADGKNVQVSLELKKKLRLATYLPLDFDAEADLVLQSTPRRGKVEVKRRQDGKTATALEKKAAIASPRDASNPVVLTAKPPQAENATDDTRRRDLLKHLMQVPGWQPATNGRGWQMANGCVEITNQPATVNWLELPYVPPDEYDFSIRVVRQNGAGVGLICAHGTTRFTGGIGGDFDRYASFDYVDGKGFHAGGNPSSVRGVDASLGQNGVEHVVCVQVRNDSLTLLRDGARVCHLTTDFSNLSTGDWKDISSWRRPDTIGLGWYETQLRVVGIEVLEVSGVGQLLD